MSFTFQRRRVTIANILILLTFTLVSACVSPGSGTGPAVNVSRPVPVALLIPHESARPSDALLAQSLENAARLAIAGLDGVEIDLRIYATGGDPARAGAAATRAVNDGAKIILGPVFAQAANAAGVAVANRNVNILSFSNNLEIAGGNVFVLGNTYRNTARRLASYAVRQGRGNIMIVHGQNADEAKGRDAIAGAIQRSGGTVTNVSSFELSQTGLINAIPMMSLAAKASGTNAIFFTSGGDGALPLLTQLLPENGVSSEDTRFIGLRRWDVPATMLGLPGVQGGWFATPDQRMQQAFNARYTAAFGRAPHPIAGLAFDGIAAIGALVKSGQRDALTIPALTQSAGFVGVGGIFRLHPDGSNERGLAISALIDNQVTEIDPAPRSFGGAGL